MEAGCRRGYVDDCSGGGRGWPVAGAARGAVAIKRSGWDASLGTNHSGTNRPTNRHVRTRQVPWLGGQEPGLASDLLLVEQLGVSCPRSGAWTPSQTEGTTWILDHAHVGRTATPF